MLSTSYVLLRPAQLLSKGLIKMSSRPPWIARLGLALGGLVALFWMGVGGLAIYGRLKPEPCGDWSAVSALVAVEFVGVGVFAGIALAVLALTQPKGVWRRVLFLTGLAFLLVPIGLFAPLSASNCTH